MGFFKEEIPESALFELSNNRGDEDEQQPADQLQQNIAEQEQSSVG